MTDPAAAPIADGDVFALTVTGHAQLEDSETSLSREELELLVLVDGKAGVAQICRAVPGVSPDAARAKLAALLADGLIRAAKPSEAVSFVDFDFTAPEPGAEVPASPEAEASVSALERAGYYVRIARRPRARHAIPAGAKPVALVVDDDPDIVTLLKSYLKLHDFAIVTAGNRAEVIAAFRRPTPFDLVLLDVQLPDIDGFAILAKMRARPALREVPVIMLTASATRAAVLKGLHYGADGYVTKPFQFDSLMKAVRTVLGLEEPAVSL